MSSESKPEFTGYRDLCYNVWHRKALQRWHYMIDIDSVEWRSSHGIVAIIERALFDSHLHTRQEILEYKKFQLLVTSNLAEKCKVPAYLVLYERSNPDAPEPWRQCSRNCLHCKNAPNVFHIYSVERGNAFFQSSMSPKEYATFLANLAKEEA